MYKVLIRPVLTYAFETWTLSKTNEQQLSLKESCFNVFLERNKRVGHGGKRYNYELYEIFNKPNIVNYTEVKRLAWAGYLVHMNNDRTSIGRALGAYEQ
jgi:hypothetical protein